MHAFLLRRLAASEDDHAQAARLYAMHVACTPEHAPWEHGLHQRIFLGDARFAVAMRALADTRRRASPEVPKTLRSAPHDLHHWLASHPTREAALLHAHRDGGLTMTAIARELGLSVARVSQLIAWAERFTHA